MIDISSHVYCCVYDLERNNFFFWGYARTCAPGYVAKATRAALFFSLSSKVAGWFYTLRLLPYATKGRCEKKHGKLGTHKNKTQVEREQRRALL